MSLQNQYNKLLEISGRLEKAPKQEINSIVENELNPTFRALIKYDFTDLSKTQILNLFILLDAYRGVSTANFIKRGAQYHLNNKDRQEPLTITASDTLSFNLPNYVELKSSLTECFKYLMLIEDSRLIDVRKRVLNILKKVGGH